MLHEATVQYIKDLLAAGLSHAEAARRAEVSRATVRSIATGARRVKGWSKRKPPPSDTNLIPRPDGPFVRCPGCGGKVQLPCVACGNERRRKGLNG